MRHYAPFIAKPWIRTEAANPVASAVLSAISEFKYRSTASVIYSEPLTSDSRKITQSHPFVSAGYNLADDSDCGGDLSDATDNPNVTLTMGTLASNGGPTRTILPAAGNPAIN